MKISTIRRYSNEFSDQQLYELSFQCILLFSFFPMPLVCVLSIHENFSGFWEQLWSIFQNLFHIFQHKMAQQEQVQDLDYGMLFHKLIDVKYDMTNLQKIHVWELNMYTVGKFVVNSMSTPCVKCISSTFTDSSVIRLLLPKIVSTSRPTTSRNKTMTNFRIPSVSKKAEKCLTKNGKFRDTYWEFYLQ